VPALSRPADDAFHAGADGLHLPARRKQGMRGSDVPAQAGIARMTPTDILAKLEDAEFAALERKYLSIIALARIFGFPHEATVFEGKLASLRARALMGDAS
jgi:hypothetical protein